jgi:LuxR family maltose regulon positive regulatory protein
LLLAWLYLRRGRPQAALNQFRPLLSWCKRHHLPGIILQEGLPGQELLRLAIEKGVEVEFSQQLLVTAGATGKLFPSSNPSVKIPHTNETLSSREAEVLRLLDNRATNREIAQELVITEQTVKTHLSHIMRKLDASNRAEVVKKARRLGLL